MPALPTPTPTDALAAAIATKAFTEIAASLTKKVIDSVGPQLREAYEEITRNFTLCEKWSLFPLLSR